MKRPDQTRPAAMLERLARNEEGSALIEGAIVVPVLCVLLFGVYEFSWFFYQQHLISTGLRDAARYLAHLPAPCDQTSFNWPIEQTSARNLATTGSVSGFGGYTTPGGQPCTSTTYIARSKNASCRLGARVAVSVPEPTIEPAPSPTPPLIP